MLEFVDSGRDLLLAVDSNVSEELRDLSAGVGVDLEPKGRSVIDHFSYALQTSAVDHSVIAGQVRLATSAVLGETPKVRLRNPISLWDMNGQLAGQLACH